MHQTPTQAISRTAALLAVALAVTGTATASGSMARPNDQATGSPVVVTSLTGDVQAAVQAVQSAGGRVLGRLALIGGVTAVLPAGRVVAPGFRVVPNAPLHVSDTSSGTGGVQINDVRAAVGLAPATPGQTPTEGAGVTVAVVDTGVADVPDLAGRVTHLNVSGAKTGPGGADGYGHGTFVAGLVAGDGSSSNGAHTGIAPAASVLDVKVADSTGSTGLIQVLQGLEAVADDPSVRVVNLSLSSGSELPYQLDPLDAALEALWRRGVTVVVPAGNEGPDAGTITSPGSDPVLLTAGALQDNGPGAAPRSSVAAWSSVGPAPQGVAKPDLVAPGAHVVSLRDPGSVVDEANPKAVVDGSYFLGSGTSFATAVTSGAVAALLTRRPDLSPDSVKQILTGSASAPAGLTDPHRAGAGSLDLARAYPLVDAAAGTDAQDSGRGEGNRKKGHDSADSADSAIPGNPAGWARFLDALGSGDAAAAASSWSQLPEAARNWAASSWSALSPDARNWAASAWGARNWAGASVDEWAARNWAALTWAARNWAARNWAASSWSARNWAASSWSARNWAASSWSARNWAASSWSARNWAAGNWAAGNWAAGNWAGGWS